MSKTASKVSFDEKRLKKACCGHFRSTGGLNTPDLKQLAYPTLGDRVKKLQRKDLDYIFVKSMYTHVIRKNN